MIKISETPTHLFHAEVVPMDAKELRIATFFDGTCRIMGNNFFLNTELNGFKNPEIIGIQGGGESLTEDQAREIFEKIERLCGSSYYDFMDKYENGSYGYVGTALESLKSRLKSQGLETENPYKKPVPSDFLSFPVIDIQEFEHLKFKWEQAEKSLVKLVIIKSDK